MSTKISKQTRIAVGGAVITAAEIIACDPCLDWPHDRIRAFVGAGIMPSELARLDSVSLSDRRWALTQVLARRDRRTLARWACDMATDGVQRLAGETRDAAEACLSASLAWCEGGSIDDVREAQRWLYSLGGPYDYTAYDYTACAYTAVRTAAAAADADAYADAIAIAADAYADAIAYAYAYAGACASACAIACAAGGDATAAQDYLDALAAHGGAS